MSEALDLDTLKEEVAALVATTPAYMKIGCTEEATIVSLYLKRCRDVRKEIEVRIGPVRDSAHKTWKGLIALIKEIDDKPAQVETACRRLLDDWNTREAERVKEEQRKLDEQARAAAAAEAKAEGDAKLAKAIETGKVAVVSSQVVAPVAKVAGVSQTITYKAEVTDFRAMVKAAAAGKVPLEWLLPNEQALNALARASKGTATVIGVTMRKITGVAARG